MFQKIGVRVAVIEEPLPARAAGQTAGFRFTPAQPQVRRFADQDAARDGRDCARADQAVQVNRTPVHRAVRVRVLEHDDPADRLLLADAVHVRHEATHLDDVEEPSFVPGHRHRVFDQGFRGDQLDPEAGGHAQCFHRFLGDQGRRFGHLELAPHLFHDVALAVAALGQAR